MLQFAPGVNTQMPTNPNKSAARPDSRPLTFSISAIPSPPDWQPGSRPLSSSQPFPIGQPFPFGHSGTHFPPPIPTLEACFAHEPPTEARKGQKHPQKTFPIRIQLMGQEPPMPNQDFPVIESLCHRSAFLKATVAADLRVYPLVTACLPSKAAFVTIHTS